MNISISTRLCLLLDIGYTPKVLKTSVLIKNLKKLNSMTSKKMFFDKFKHASSLSILVEALMCIFFFRSRRTLRVQRVGVHCQVFHVTRDLVLKSNLRSDLIINLARERFSGFSSFN